MKRSSVMIIGDYKPIIGILFSPSINVVFHNILFAWLISRKLHGKIHVFLAHMYICFAHTHTCTCKYICILNTYLYVTYACTWTLISHAYVHVYIHVHISTSTCICGCNIHVNLITCPFGKLLCQCLVGSPLLKNKIYGGRVSVWLL